MLAPHVEVNAFDVDELLNDFKYVACMVKNPEGHKLQVYFDIKSIPTSSSQITCHYTVGFTVTPNRR